MCLNKTYTYVCMGIHLSHMFCIQNDVNQKDALKLMLFNFASKCTIRRSKSQEELKLNVTHQLQVYTDYANLHVYSKNINSIQKITNTLFHF